MLLVAVTVGVWIASGCAGPGGRRATVISAESFAEGARAAEPESGASPGANREGSDEPAAPRPGLPDPRAERPRVVTLTPAQAREGISLDDVTLDPQARIETSSREASGEDTTVESAEDANLIDEFIGEINGRPVYASTFLSAIGARLQQESRNMSRQEWLRFAFETIRSDLYREIDNELLVAEQIAEIPPEFREPGLRRLQQQLRRRSLSQNYGSEQIMQQRIEDEEGLTEEEFLRRQRDELLVMRELGNELRRRVYVSSRDTELAYRRRYEEFNPPPTARLRRIRVWASDAEEVAEVRRRIESEGFEEAATGPPNTASPDTGGLVEVELKGPYHEASLFRSPEALNEAAQGLLVGQTAGPIESDPWVYWVHLESIEAPRMGLYDAQAVLMRELEDAQFGREEVNLKLQLRERAGITPEAVHAMAERLLEIADRWYYVGPDSPEN